MLMAKCDLFTSWGRGSGHHICIVGCILESGGGLVTWFMFIFTLTVLYYIS